MKIRGNNFKYITRYTSLCLTLYSNIILAAIWCSLSRLVNRVLLNDTERTINHINYLEGKPCTLYYIYNKNITLLWFEKSTMLSKQRKTRMLIYTLSNGMFRNGCFERSETEKWLIKCQPLAWLSTNFRIVKVHLFSGRKRIIRAFDAGPIVTSCCKKV